MKHRNDRRAVTLVESLVSIMLLSVLLVSVLGAFFISKISATRAHHRMAAMNKVREHMEREIKAGCNEGQVDVNYYVTVPSSAGETFILDDRGTIDLSDDLAATIQPAPYPAAITTINTVSYKRIGFVVTWDETAIGGGPATTCREAAATYVSEHS